MTGRLISKNLTVSRFKGPITGLVMFFTKTIPTIAIVGAKMLVNRHFITESHAQEML